jgi:hypothetical protein
LPKEIPLRANATLKVAGMIMTEDMIQSYVQAEGEYDLLGSSLGQYVGVDLKDILTSETDLRIDKGGFHVTGKAQTAFHAGFSIDGDATVAALFGKDPNQWYATMSGDLAIGGLHLVTASARADHNGVVLSGQLQTTISTLSMYGSITKSGVQIGGDASFSIPIKAPKQVLQTVTNASVCGYEVVTDAGQCGLKTVTSASQCGSSYVTSSLECGWDTITNGAVCGWDTVWGCISSGFSDCKSAKSCQVPASCYVANTCRVAASCSVPATCQETVTVPDFDFGKVTGTAHVDAGTSGLHGSFSASFCATGGACQSASTGTVSITPSSHGGQTHLQVCVSGLPGVSGQFCQDL